MKTGAALRRGMYVTLDLNPSQIPTLNFILPLTLTPTLTLTLTLNLILTLTLTLTLSLTLNLSGQVRRSRSSIALHGICG